MTDADRDKWEQKYAARDVHAIPGPDEWLLECVRELQPGRALDLACGLGQNAVGLARLGWQVDAVDVSPRGLELASELADRSGVTVNWICADLDAWSPVAERYDLAIVFRYLDWNRVPPIVDQALKPGGLLCYETFAASQMKRSHNHLNNPAFTVQQEDWQRFFPQFECIVLEMVSLPSRDVARFAARKTGDI